MTGFARADGRRTGQGARGLLALARVVATVAAVACAPRAAHAQDTLDQLLASFARIEALECHFHEEKRIALLSMPIVSDGTIHYVRPGRLARRVSTPSPQVILIEGSSLRMSEGGHDESIDLASQPVVRSFVDSIVQLLAGDRAALERSYVISMEGWGSSSPGGSGWRVTLRPRASPLSELLASVVFEGSGTTLARMIMSEVSGDVTTTTFSDVDAARRYTPAELTRVFSLR